jgi:hypothetical protein
MKTFGSTTIVAVALLVASGCGPKEAATPTPETQANRSERNSDVITAAALADPVVRSGDVLEAVRRLRPQFLVTRGAVSIVGKNAGVVHASIDFAPLIPVEYLKRVRVAEISEIRYLNARDAALRFGTSAATGGVIVVTSRR